MSERFYIYGTYLEDETTMPTGTYRFPVDEYQKIEIPAFLIWILRHTEDYALLCKIQSAKRVGDRGMIIVVDHITKIRLNTPAILNSTWPSDVPLMHRIKGRDYAADIVMFRSLLRVWEDDKADLIKTTILRLNRGLVDETFFADDRSPQSELTEKSLQAADACHTALRLFGVRETSVPPLHEHQILDFDIEHLFKDSQRLVSTNDGKHYFEHNGRRLYLHKVDRTVYERCLGVDLIYNYVDQQRLVFVQYKCQKTRGKYHPGSDDCSRPQLENMCAIPQVQECPNVSEQVLGNCRLCRCPVFVKLCKREVASAHAIPIGVYFPICVWKKIVNTKKGIGVQDEPHFNNDQFNELVRIGLIGATPDQSRKIELHLIQKANDQRLKLVFEESNVN